MEDTLRVQRAAKYQNVWLVLILVLMEDTLRALTDEQKALVDCLNPCFNGRYS